jgi:hypothetical protein
MTKRAFCTACDAAQAVTVEPLEHPDTTRRYRGGDMVCAVCGFVICTQYQPVEGVEPPQQIGATGSQGCQRSASELLSRSRIFH